MSNQAEELINEVRLLYQSLIQVGEKIHAGSSITIGMRAVLEYLDRNGNTTVPDIARARRVSRQRVQTLVNPLLDAGLVESIANPASRRSPLMHLTEAGAATILDMRRREGRVMRIPISDQSLQLATDTLRRLRESLEQDVSTAERSKPTSAQT